MAKQPRKRPSAPRAPREKMKTLKRPSQMRAAEHEGEHEAEEKAKQRNVVEKSIVWGLIGILVLIVIVESSARLRYNRTLTPLQKGMEAANSGKSVKRDDLLATVPGTIPPPTVEKRFLDSLDTYYWSFSSIFKSYHIKVRFQQDDHELSDLITGPEALKPTE